MFEDYPGGPRAMLDRFKEQTAEKLVKHPPDVMKYHELGFHGGIIDVLPPPGSIRKHCDNCGSALVIIPAQRKILRATGYNKRPPLCVPCIGAVYEAGKVLGLQFGFLGLTGPVG